MTRDEIIANKANLSNADLRGANLRYTDLSGADLRYTDLSGADLSNAYLSNAYLRGADLRSANLRYAYLRGANLRYACLSGADLRGANLRNAKYEHGILRSLKVFANIYDYQCEIMIFQDNTRWIRMGCLFKSIEDWDSTGIENSNLSEYPNDGSPKSEQRKLAFEFCRKSVMLLK